MPILYDAQIWWSAPGSHAAGSERPSAKIPHRPVYAVAPGRSQFGAVLYRTTPLFLKLFGLSSLDDLPDPSAWDPTPDEEADLRERLLKAGEARAGGHAAADAA